MCVLHSASLESVTLLRAEARNRVWQRLEGSLGDPLAHSMHRWKGFFTGYYPLANLVGRTRVPDYT